VRIRTNVPSLPPHGARVAVFEVTEATAEVDPSYDLVAAPPDQLAAVGVSGVPARHPVSGALVSLVDPSQREVLRARGLEVFVPARQVMLQVAAAAQRSADRFIGLAEVQAALDLLEPTHGALVDAVVPRPVSLARLTGVLKRLVGEGVGVRDLRAILEALAEDAREEHDLIELVEIARRGLARSIMATWAPGRQLRAWVLSPAIEQTVREAIRREDGRTSLALPPRVTDEILRAAAVAFAGEARPIVLATPDVRRYVRQLLALQFPTVVVLGTAEIHEGVQLEVAGSVSVGASPRPGL
jgi:type III secretion protein V